MKVSSKNYCQHDFVILLIFEMKFKLHYKYYHKTYEILAGYSVASAKSAIR